MVEYKIIDSDPQEFYESYRGHNEWIEYDEVDNYIKLLQLPAYRTENWADESGNQYIFYSGYDIDKARSELKLSNQLRDFNYKIQKIILYEIRATFNSDKLEQLKSLYVNLSEEEFTEQFQYKYQLASFIDWELGDSIFIDTLTIPAINESTDEILYDVQKHFGGKYTRIELSNGKTLELRIADHSGKYANVAFKDRYLSIVIANENPTEAFYKESAVGMSNEYYYNDSYTAEEIITEIQDKIAEIKLEEMPIEWDEKYASASEIKLASRIILGEMDSADKKLPVYIEDKNKRESFQAKQIPDG